MAEIERHNAMINAKYAEWSLAWDDLLQVDDALVASGAYHPIDRSAKDPCDHMNRAFNFIAASPETRRACFALLPRGDAMYARVAAFFERGADKMTEAQARAKLIELGTAIEACDHEHEGARWAEPEILTLDAFQRVRKTGFWTGVEVLPEFPVAPDGGKADPEIHAAAIFVFEPLYLGSGNHFEPPRWVQSVLLPPEVARVHELNYQLWVSGWWVMCDGQRCALVQLP